MNEPVTQGDRYNIPFDVNGDLTGATTICRARRAGSAPVILTHAVLVPASGSGVILDTSALPVGEFNVELEATNGPQIVTYKVREPLVIVAAIG
jgi:hypothetical protein